MERTERETATIRRRFGKYSDGSFGVPGHCLIALVGAYLCIGNFRKQRECGQRGLQFHFILPITISAESMRRYALLRQLLRE